MPLRDDPLADTRVRLEGQLELLEAAEPAYEAHADRRTADWTRAAVADVIALEERTAQARGALVHLFRERDMPVEERALLFRVDRARGRFLADTWRRMTGDRTPPVDASLVIDLLQALHRVVEDTAPIYERIETPRYSWQGPPRLVCRLSQAGLISGERFFPMSQLLELGVRYEHADHGPARGWVDDHELEYRDLHVVRSSVELTRAVARLRDTAGRGGPPTWVIGTGQANAAPRLFFSALGAVFHPTDGFAPRLTAAQIARVLDGYPVDHVDRCLRLPNAEFMPLDELRYRLAPLSEDRLSLQWNQAELVLTFAPGDAQRLLELVRRR